MATGCRAHPSSPTHALNFAENLLKATGAGDALVFRGEDKVEKRLSWDELHALVSRLQQFFVSVGVKAGDRVAAMMPNMPETIAAMLAAASLGAVWSSCSPDFGEQGVLDRFGQIEPVIFIAPDGYWYNGKAIPVGDKIAAVAAKLPSLRKVVVVDYLGRADEVAADIPIAGVARRGDRAVRRTRGHLPPDALRPSALHPVLVRHDRHPEMHRPLGRRHAAAARQGTHAPCRHRPGRPRLLLHHLRLDDVELAGLGARLRATVLLYDGSPFHPDGNVAVRLRRRGSHDLFRHLGEIHRLRAQGGPDADRRRTSLAHVRTISSTGSPLSPEGFEFVYDGIKPDVHLASISGGTDIVSCFVLGVPTEPVWAGEIQAAGLGMAMDVWDDDGRSVRGEKGELVCTKPFPSMPIGFWNDPDGKKYHAAYFDRFDNVWCHGDFAEWTEHGGIIIHGRSDATLNPGGVRIGTAEIYNQVEQMPEIAEALCIGQDFDDDVRVVLFVRLAGGHGPGRGSGKAHPHEDPHRRQPAPRPGTHRRGRRHSAHQVRQDHRTGRARRRARPAGQEPRGAGQSGSPGAVSRSAAARDVTVPRMVNEFLSPKFTSISRVVHIRKLFRVPVRTC